MLLCALTGVCFVSIASFLKVYTTVLTLKSQHSTALCSTTALHLQTPKTKVVWISLLQKPQQEATTQLASNNTRNSASRISDPNIDVAVHDGGRCHWQCPVMGASLLGSLEQEIQVDTKNTILDARNLIYQVATDTD
jgi:hypothetical protein